MTHLTELEKNVLRTLSEPNGNGNEIDTNYADYLCIFCFEISDRKVLGGVLSSLVKKELIVLDTEGVDDIGDLTTVKFTPYGYELTRGAF